VKLFGLIGYPLGHSFSKIFFSRFFEQECIANCRYENFPIDHIGDLEKILKEYEDLQGLNVTIPYKESIIPYLDNLEETARQIGAVNTIKIRRDGNNYSLEGFNTDVIGFRDSFLPLLRKHDKSALVLGSGGASKAVIHVLKELKMSYLIVSRNPGGNRMKISYKQVDKKLVENYSIIINTTPLGTYPDVISFPDLPYSNLSERHLLFDLIYNPEETEFLRKGRMLGSRVKNGYEMLERQAIAAWNIWNS